MLKISELIKIATEAYDAHGDIVVQIQVGLFEGNVETVRAQEYPFPDAHMVLNIATSTLEAMEI